MADDEDHGTVYGWKAEYAKSGRSKCQVTGEVIAAKALRIGKEVDNPFKAGTRMHLWHSVDGLFDSFRKGRDDKPRINATDEIVAFDDLKSEDQEKLQELIDAENAFRAGLAAVDDEATRLEHTKDGGVFWSVVQSENTTRVKWGAIGDSGRVSEKEHKTEAAATKFVDKRIAEKIAGGYVEADEEDEEDEDEDDY